MKAPTRWYTSGRKPDRNLEAALLSGALGLLEAVVQGKRRPWLHAATRATASALAMDHHRVADRVKANERYGKIAESAADALDQIIEGVTVEQQGTRQQMPERCSVEYRTIVHAWNHAAALTGCHPSRIDVPMGTWLALAPTERHTLESTAFSLGVSLTISLCARVLVYPRRPLLRS